ncbi:MAG: hypothetical protein ACD_39C00946G0001 [uncultured bacterium]|nr:MAG: hypothetical protein ACD_39C00946G0001 [uncultured bacterium]
MFFIKIRSLSVILALLSAIPFLAGCGSEPAMAQFVKISGIVEARSKPADKFAPALQQGFLPSGGAVRTMPESSADLLLPENRGIIEVKADTYFELPLSINNIRQESGTIIYRINQDKGGFTIDTPHGLTGVLGTIFELTVNSEATTVGVKEGKVSLTNKQGETRTVEANEKLGISASGIFTDKAPFDLKTDGFKYIKQDEKWVPAKE